MAGDLELHVWAVRGGGSTASAAKLATSAAEEAQPAGAGTSSPSGTRGSSSRLEAAETQLAAAVGAAMPAEGASRREPLPGSPFFVSSTAGRAHAAGSSVSGFERIETRGDKDALGRLGLAPARRASKEDVEARAAEEPYVHAGDTLVVSPKICDKLGNDTAAPEGDLTFAIDSADGESLAMEPTVSVRQGLTRYEVKYTPTVTGKYQLHVCLAGHPIAGSPVAFNCVPGPPDVSLSKLTLPFQDGIPDNIMRDHATDHLLLYSATRYELLVQCFDGCGNALDRGGSRVHSKIAAIGGVVPPKNSGNDFETIDRRDGSYAVQLERAIPSDLKVSLALDGRDFPLMFIDFVRSPEEAAKALAKSREESGSRSNVMKVSAPTLRTSEHAHRRASSASECS